MTGPMGFKEKKIEKYPLKINFNKDTVLNAEAVSSAGGGGKRTNHTTRECVRAIDLPQY